MKQNNSGTGRIFNFFVKILKIAGRLRYDVIGHGEEPNL